MNTLKSSAAPPWWARMLLAGHSHPMLVQFPQAFFAFAPVLLLFYYVLGHPCCERAAYYLLASGLLLSLPAILTGFLHWIYKYSRSARGLFTFKMAMSFVLVGLAAAALCVHTVKGPLPGDVLDVSVMALYLLQLPVTVLLGHAGGRIVFG